MKSCETCEYSYASTSEVTMLECRHKPPMPFAAKMVHPLTRHEQQVFIGAFPLVTRDAWCGMYFEKVDKIDHEFPMLNG